MLGKPKYNYNDRVGFNIFENSEKKIKIGVVSIIDRYGTFFDNSDVSYDILVEDENCLYKHIREDSVWLVEKNEKSS